MTQFWDAAESVEAADHVNSAGICILFDLVGYTSDHRQDVLALRPAPIQVHYHGYMGTTGAPWIQVKRYEEHIEMRPRKGAHTGRVHYHGYTDTTGDLRIQMKDMKST